VAIHDYELRIDDLVLEIAPSSMGSARRRAILEDALKKLGERFAVSPLRGAFSLGTIAIERLSIDTLSADALLGPRGAELLADELYALITRRLG